MKLFKRKNKNEENGNVNLLRMAFQEAMRELEQEKNLNKIKQNRINELEKYLQDYNNLENNLEVLQNTIENIKELCKDKNGRVISSLTILKELGE